MMNPKAVIFGITGYFLTPEERSFFIAQQPLGFILYTRNCKDPQQLQDLIIDLKSLLHHKPVPILIDQEGGRVARLRPPYWNEYKPALYFYEAIQNNDNGIAMAEEQAFNLAIELSQMGINVNCAPCCDLLLPQTHQAIGNRAYGPDPIINAELALATIRGFHRAGIVPVIKHIPGHGRALIDSHMDLPSVDVDLETLKSTDFEVFKRVSESSSNLWAMTAHVKYNSIDPINPSTQSPKIIADIIRDYIGFEGILISDDLNMKALDGSLGLRTQKTLEAGCDVVLHCNGNMVEMMEIVQHCHQMTNETMAKVIASITSAYNNSSQSQIESC